MRPFACLFALASALACSACDNREAFHEPDPSWSRMLEQRRGDPYSASSVFADGKTMREPPRGTVARDDDPPRPPITRELLTRGRVVFERTCATCHGMAGNGQSVVATKMTRRPPPSLHEDRLRALSEEQIFTVATNGYGLMPAYGDMLSADDRWAVVSYVKALQLSQHASVAALPPDLRAQLASAAKEAP
jgi:mono/diheme cytochrome c family protein